MDEQKRKSPEMSSNEETRQDALELDHDAAQQYAREAMERRYMYFLD